MCVGWLITCTFIKTVGMGLSTSKVHVECEDVLLRGGVDPGLLILTHPLFEKVGLTLERYKFHPVEGVGCVI